MVNKSVAAAFYICASICGKDGVISSQEEALLTESFKLEFNIDDNDINILFDQFFESEALIDSYLEEVIDPDLRKKVVAIAELSAAADGLDIRENLALQRTKLTWSNT